MDDTTEPTAGPGASVIPFATPKPAELFVLPDLYESDVSTDDVEFDDLCFLARRLILSAIADTDWTVFRKVVSTLVDETDAATVIRLMQNAEVEVIVGGR